MSTVDKEVALSVCANCGKEGNKVNNVCAKCKQVKYCNAVCKKKHRSKHKKQCERRVAELHDEKLFKQPPPDEDCPICFQQLPFLHTGSTYYACCGKMICSGCVYAPLYDNQGNKVDNKKCPFCRTPWPSSDDDMIKREKKRIEAKDPRAIFNIGIYYRDGICGYPQDHTKALELWHQAGEFGSAKAYTNIGYSYQQGDGVEVDDKKATYYYELAAMKGDEVARHNLGLAEERAGNVDRALKHYMIAARDGHSNSLERIKWLYTNGRVPKEDYTKALQAYQAYLGEIRSRQRDEAAAADENNRYY